MCLSCTLWMQRSVLSSRPLVIFFLKAARCSDLAPLVLGCWFFKWTWAKVSLWEIWPTGWTAFECGFQSAAVINVQIKRFFFYLIYFRLVCRFISAVFWCEGCAERDGSPLASRLKLTICLVVLVAGGWFMLRTCAGWRKRKCLAETRAAAVLEVTSRWVQVQSSGLNLLLLFQKTLWWHHQWRDDCRIVSTDSCRSEPTDCAVQCVFKSKSVKKNKILFTAAKLNKDKQSEQQQCYFSLL